MDRMNRPLLWAAVSFSAGITLGYYWQPILPGVLLFTLFLIFLSVYSTKYIKRHSGLLLNGQHKKDFLSCLLIVFLIGFIYLYIEEYRYNSPYSCAAYNDQQIHKVRGEVRENLTALQGNKIFLKPYLIDNQPVRYGLIQLDRRYLSSALKQDEIIEAEVYLKFPELQRNPGGFSNYHHLKKKGIFSIGYLNKGRLSIIGYRRTSFAQLVVKLKGKMLSIFDMTVVYPYNEFLKAILLGERENLPVEWYDNFTRAGVNHLLAVSGLHISFVLLVFIALLRLIRAPVKFRNIFISIILVLYILITGIRPSVIRAGMLALGFLWGPSFKRTGDIYNLLGLTVIINLLVKPYDLFTAGFQYSYLVLITILLWHKILIRIMPLALAVSSAAMLGSFPVTLYYFNLLTLVGVFTNLWAIPLVGLVVALALIGLLMGLINPIFCWIIAKPVIFLLWIIDHGIELSNRIPFGCWEMATPHFLNCFLIYCFILSFPFILERRVIPLNQLKQKRRIRILSFLLIIFSLINLIIPLFNQRLEVIFLSVGQGDAIFIHLPSGKNIMVDCGGKAGFDSNQGEYTIKPFLQYRGIKHLDFLFITHFDTDHALGAIPLLREKKVRQLFLPYNFNRNELAVLLLDLAEKNEIPVYTVQEGNVLKTKEVKLQILNPTDGYVFNRNENSIVLKLLYNKFSLLLTGDLGREGEIRMISKGYNLKSRLLKLGHHGSKNSSSPLFIREVYPQDVIISVGNNNYGHPAQSLINSLKRKEIKIWRTDQQGAIIIKSNGQSYVIQGFIKREI